MTASPPPGSGQGRRPFRRIGGTIDWVTVFTASPYWVAISRVFRAGAYPVALPREARPLPASDEDGASPVASRPEDVPEMRPALRLVVAGEPRQE